ncbi:hypothetical protein PDENDC454_25144, partial [Paenibacillus dendritiformis C454]
KILHSFSFSPQIPSNPAKMEEIAAPLQEFLFADRASRKKLQNCSFGRSSRMARTSPCFHRARNVHAIATFYS